MNDRPRRVVLLIDYDNLQICASRDTPGRDLQLTPVVHLAQRYGTVILARAYAEWNLSTERLAVYKAGIEPAFAPVLRTESDRSGKSLADTVMVAEGMDMLWTLSPEVVVLATSDKDLIPLVRVAKQRGSYVVVLGSDFTAIPLREMADEHVTYRQLITDVSGRYATEAGPGRQPAALPEPSRRRRDRNGRERPAATPAAQARAEKEAAHAAAVEPVAPVSATDSETQAGGRRRRRRGSRRRLERTGAPGETPAGVEPGHEAATPEAEHEITPTTSAADVAQASGATLEPPPAPAPPAPEPAPPEAVETPPTPAPRERRRRTRRTTATAAEPIVEGPEASAAASAGEDAPMPPPPAEAPPPSADVLPAPEPAVDGEEPAPARRTRARRVASASRGRSRRV